MWGYEREEFEDCDEEHGEEQYEYAEEDPEPTEEELKYIELRQQLLEAKRKQMKVEISSAEKKLPDDNYESFFGPSQPIIVGRLILRRLQRTKNAAGVMVHRGALARAGTRPVEIDDEDIDLDSEDQVNPIHLDPEVNPIHLDPEVPETETPVVALHTPLPTLTASEFSERQTLLEARIHLLQSSVDGVRTEVDGVRTEMETRFRLIQDQLAIILSRLPPSNS